MSLPEIPDWVTYPEERWIEISPQEAGLDEMQWKAFLAERDVKGAAWEGEVHEGDDWGTVFTRGGYLVQAWGDPYYQFQTASVGKAFNRAVFGLAADAGLLHPNDLVNETWTGEGLLSHPHKYLDTGHHKKLRWSHLLGAKDRYVHSGGFPVTNGYFWQQGSTAQSSKEKDKSVPEWANWTGDALCDNYAHAEPGTVEIYSSGGMWRLNQSLTMLWDRDIKEVLDEGLFSKIGIPAGRWEWMPGRDVHDKRNFYPTMPGYGDFIDPPYEIEGHIVRGGGGWAIMCAADLARFGLLIASGGYWKGERLIDAQWLRNHAGGNGSFVGGESEHFTAIGRVTTEGVSFPFPESLFAGPVQVR